jgi:hypothetical protein
MNVKSYMLLSVNGSHAAMYQVLKDSLGVAVNRYRHKTSWTRKAFDCKT